MDPSSLPEIRHLVIQWLTRWHGVAHRTGSRMEFVYKNALTTIKAHDGPVRTVEDCAKIKFFGPKLCEKVKKSIHDHWKSKGIPFDEEKPAEDEDEEPSSQTSTSSKVSQSNGARRKKAYVPANRSGAYAILVALYEADKRYQQSCVQKSQLLELAQRYCDESMTKPKPGTHYTAFSSMKTLIKNEMVTSKQSRNAYYSLTDAGNELAKKLYDHLTEANGDEAATSEDDVESVTLNKRQDQFSLLSGSFEVTLLVDTREKVAGKTNIVSELLPYGVKAELRALPAGDFVWIAKEKVIQGTSTKNAPARELVFDFVIERKKADDLSSSIMDGRYHEQKQRLRNCGLQKPIYLVEGLNKNTNYAVPYRRLLQSITDSSVIDGFNVKCTRDFDDTINYLVSVTQYIERNFSKQNLLARAFDETPVDDFHLISYNSFEHSAKKITNFNVGEMFVKHLVQFAQMSIPKAKAIISQYPTLRHFIYAYDDCTSDKEKQRLIAKLKYGYNARCIGPVLSDKVCKFYNHQTD